MNSEKQRNRLLYGWPSLVFAAGLVLWILSLLLLFFWLELFSEALLVPWYCCDTTSLPPQGSGARLLNDFFASFPGLFLPGLLFIAAERLIFRARMNEVSNRTWLPMLFFCGNILLFLLSIVVTNLSWGVSNQLVGPRVGGIDAGYHRTWYGIVCNLSLIILFLVTLARVRWSTGRGKKALFPIC